MKPERGRVRVRESNIDVYEIYVEHNVNFTQTNSARRLNFKDFSTFFCLAFPFWHSMELNFLQIFFMVCCTNNTANIILFSTVIFFSSASIYILMGRE